MRHPLFIARTILVKNNEVEEAVKVLNRILGREGLIEQHKRQERYEKPKYARRRINYERVKSIYSEDMARKIQFISRKNRIDPFPGCS